MKCMHCGCEKFTEKKVRFNPTVKDEIVEVIAPAFVCSECNEALMNSEQMNFLRKVSADEYKKNHGLLTSSQIISFRESLGMSQSAFARYLSVGEASIKRWETYFIQDASQDELIRLKCDDAVAEMNFLNIQWKRNKPDKFNGFRHFNFELFKNVALFLIQETKASLLYLNKFHFYIDFLHFKSTGTSLTGARYVPLKYGPCPDQYTLLYDVLTRKGYLKKRNAYSYILLQKPDLSIFDDKEMRTLKAMEALYKEYGKQKIFELSHDEKGFDQTEECSFIDYKYAKDILLPIQN